MHLTTVFMNLSKQEIKKTGSSTKRALIVDIQANNLYSIRFPDNSSVDFVSGPADLQIGTWVTVSKYYGENVWVILSEGLTLKESYTEILV